MMKLLEKPYFTIVLYLFIILSSFVYYFYLYESWSNDFLSNMFYLLGSCFGLSLVLIFLIQRPLKYFFIAFTIIFLIITALYAVFCFFLIIHGANL